MHNYNPSSEMAETGRVRSQSQPGLQSKTVKKKVLALGKQRPVGFCEMKARHGYIVRSCLRNIKENRKKVSPGPPTLRVPIFGLCGIGDHTQDLVSADQERASSPAQEKIQGSQCFISS